MTSAILEQYRRKLDQLNHTRKRMELLFSRGEIKRRDLHAVYESLFLRAVVGFEGFCDSLFHKILHGQIEYPPSRVERRITAKTRKAMQDVVYRGPRGRKENYLNWLPWKDALETANLFLVKGRPFTLVDDSQKDALIKIGYIRNAIAHSSKKSVKDFRTRVIATAALLPTERKPAAFLRSSPSSGVTRFEAYVAQLGTIATTIYDKPK